MFKGFGRLYLRSQRLFGIDLHIAAIIPEPTAFASEADGIDAPGLGHVQRLFRDIHLAVLAQTSGFSLNYLRVIDLPWLRRPELRQRFLEPVEGLLELPLVEQRPGVLPHDLPMNLIAAFETSRTHFRFSSLVRVTNFLELIIKRHLVPHSVDTQESTMFTWPDGLVNTFALQ